MLSLQRITTSQKYLPFIDGFRVFAILPVMIDHFILSYEKKFYTITNTDFYKDFHLAFGDGLNSVFLFFVLSGFLLGLPFARRAFNKEPQPNTKDYLLRRLTRLGPPYVILLTLILITHVFIMHKSSLSEIMPHYLASLIYSHTWIYHTHPVLNFVLWSLEIELQFYILMPLLSSVFLLPKNQRRVLILLAIVFFSLINLVVKPPFISLFNYFHYFMAGFLAVDLYISNKATWKSNYLFDTAAVLLFLVNWIGLVNRIFLPYILCGLIICTCFSKVWDRFLGFKLFTIIGGMCFTIYMLHMPLSALFINRFLVNTFIGEHIVIDFIVRLLITFTLVWIFSLFFFITIERPTMQKDWYKTGWFSKKTKANHSL